MEQSSQLKCSICYNASHGPTCTSCSDIFTNVITSLTTKPQNPFSDIENLVFQGGGVKGAAYLGVLQQLESESTGFLKRVKRVAGSSAGSIVALYLALNLDLKEIQRLVIDEKYSSLLDDGIPLIIDGQNTLVRAKTVFLAAIEYFKILKEEAHDPDKSKEALKKIRKIGEDIRDYFVRDRWFYEVYFFNKVIGEKGAEAITSWILDLLDVSYVAEGIENKSEKDKEKRDKMAGMVKDEIKKGFKDVPENQINRPPRASAPQARASLEIEVKELSVVRERRNDVVYVKESVKKSCLVVEELKRPRMDLGVGSIMDSEKKELNVVKERRNEVYMKESVQKSCLAEDEFKRPRMDLGVGSIMDSEKKELSVVKEGRNEIYIKESVQKSCLADENLISQPGMGWGIKSIIGSLKSYRRNFLDKYLFEQGNRPGARYKFNLSDPDDIKLLHYSLAELLKQMKVYGDEEVEYKYNKDKIQPKEDKEETDKRLNIKREDTKKDPLGVFTGNYVKYKLIIEPIASMVGKDKFGDNGPTFADLASVTENGKKVFKDLYITAFNSGTNRTEVFSAEHTPHAFVADAVRASMSIPGFFKPVNILQKNGDKVENRKIFYEKNNETRSEDVLFMDGGILDNYPLWIFDDIKYLIPNINPNAQGEEARRHRFTIQNPRTLGFKLLDPKTLARYTEPYIGNDLSQMKRTNETSQKNGSKLSFAFGSLFGGKSDQEENEFVKFDNCPRTVYVDNADVSAVAFNMDEKVVTKLINNGKKSVTEYGKRYGRSFVNEGQAYPAYSC